MSHRDGIRCGNRPDHYRGLRSLPLPGAIPAQFETLQQLASGGVTDAQAAFNNLVYEINTDW